MPVRLTDVAARAGVGYGTASRALSGKGRVSAAARARVKAAARELGYSRNVAAAALGARGQRPSGGLKVAYVTPYPETAQALLREVCPVFGFRGQAFDPTGFSDPKAMLRQFWHQGYDALLINFEAFPWTEAETRTADWSRFAVVKFKRVYPGLPFHLIRHSAFDYMRLTLNRVLATGARRIAVLLVESGSFEDNEARLGAVLAARETLGKTGTRIAYRLWSGSTEQPDADSLAWLEREHPDVVVSVTWPPLRHLLEAGWRIPEDAGFATVLRPYASDHGLPYTSIAGCRVGRREILRRALIQLREMIGFGIKGFPELPVEHVIEPQWVEGRTLPEPKKTPA
ncbi:MAG: LacI family DNA-binding transcriptional regulator [Opitutales bacterium]